MARKQRIFLSLSTGVLLSLAWLGLPGWTLFFALIPLLFLDDYFVTNKQNYRGVSFWGHTLLTFLFWNTLTTWWLMHATLVGAAMAIVVNSFLMSLVWWLAHIARRTFNKNLGYISLIVFWLAFEYFHYNWDIEWPWLNLGNGFANNIKMVQWYEYTGTLGGTLWILIMNVILFKIAKNVLSKAPIKNNIANIFSFNFMLLIPLSVSFSMYFSYKEESNPKKIVIVQPNIDPYSENYDVEAENEKLKKFLSLANTKMSQEIDFVIGPETIFERYPDWNESYTHRNRQLLQIKAWLKNYPKTEMVFGASTSKVYKSDEATPTARTRNGVTYDVFNTAVFIDKNANHDFYHKSILVSGVEKVPFMKYLGFLKNIFIDLGGTSGSLGRQEEASVFTSADSTKIAPVICYESVFGEYVTNYINKGAQLIFIITNDGWWKDTPGYKQHMSFARLRAIETRRSIARSGNTGISCFINQRGEVLQKTNWWVEDAITGDINKNNKITFYVKHGDYLARVAMFVSILFIILLVVKRITAKTNGFN